LYYYLMPEKPAEIPMIPVPLNVLQEMNARVTGLELQLDDLKKKLGELMMGEQEPKTEPTPDEEPEEPVPDLGIPTVMLPFETEERMTEVSPEAGETLDNLHQLVSNGAKPLVAAAGKALKDRTVPPQKAHRNQQPAEETWITSGAGDQRHKYVLEYQPNPKGNHVIEFAAGTLAPASDEVSLGVSVELGDDGQLESFGIKWDLYDSTHAYTRNDVALAALLPAELSPENKALLVQFMRCATVPINKNAPFAGQQSVFGEYGSLTFTLTEGNVQFERYTGNRTAETDQGFSNKDILFETFTYNGEQQLVRSNAKYNSSSPYIDRLSAIEISDLEQLARIATALTPGHKPTS
jgi:hypothetical protein